MTVEANACICDAVICKDAHIGNGAGVARGSVIGESCSVSASEVVSPDSLNITRVTSQEIMRNDIPNALTMSIDCYNVNENNLITEKKRQFVENDN